ncbi:MAG: hypothetical protein ACIAQU_08000 [Phycisphaerales bacterium JB064]
MVGAVIGALVGGAAGAAIWAAVGYYTGYEIGWIAWGVGVLTGVGTAIGANALGGGPGTGTGILAAVVALAAVLCGKLAVVELHYQNDADLALAQEFNHEVMMTYVADELAEQWEEDGIVIDWPDLPDNQWYRWREQDYPPDLWAEAQAWWDETPADHQAKVREGYREMHESNISDAEEMYAEFESEGLLSAFDAIWMLLAVGSAFGIGRGGADD